MSGRKGSMIFLFVLIMGAVMFVKTFRTFRAFEIMPFTGTEGENKHEWEQGKTFHHAPLSQSHVKRNTVCNRSARDSS